METGGPLKEKEIIEYEKRKDLCTYTDVVSASRAIYQLSNGGEGSKFNKFLENSLFLK